MVNMHTNMKTRQD